MVKNGIYRLNGLGDRASLRALVLVRNGQFIGSDGLGALVRGTCVRSSGSNRAIASGALSMPPDGMLVTGLTAGPGGGLIEFVAAFEPPSPRSVARIEIGGGEVDVEIKYVGTLGSKAGGGRGKMASRYGRSIGEEEGPARLAG